MADQEKISEKFKFKNLKDHLDYYFENVEQGIKDRYIKDRYKGCGIKNTSLMVARTIKRDLFEMLIKNPPCKCAMEKYQKQHKH